MHACMHAFKLMDEFVLKALFLFDTRSPLVCENGCCTCVHGPGGMIVRALFMEEKAFYGREDLPMKERVVQCVACMYEGVCLPGLFMEEMVVPCVPGTVPRMFARPSLDCYLEGNRMG